MNIRDEREMVRAQIKDRKRQLAKLDRMDREKERELRFLRTVLNDLDSLEGMSYTELLQFRSRLLKLKPIFEEDEVMEAVGEVTIILTLIDKLVSLRQAGEHLIREVKRQKKIEEHRAAVQTSTGVEPKCIVCQKRPRHFGDYCKRCVPPNERPTGKV